MRRRVLVVLCAAALGACSSGTSEPVAPEPTASASAAAEPAPSGDGLRGELVEAHKHAVEACFGGFGKGVPYAAELTVADGAITEAKVEPLDPAVTSLPGDCIAKHFRGQKLSGAGASVRARFGVKDPDCPAASCPAKDLPCVFRHDIACSIVIDR
jgi:hypothetical protein